jgi:hypothetical protein
MSKVNMINPIAQIERSNAWTKKPLTDGKLISTAKKGNAMDWTAKAMQDDVLAKEKQTTSTKKLGAYQRGYKNGI